VDPQPQQSPVSAVPDWPLDEEHELSVLRDGLRLSPAQRLREGQKLWDWYRKLHPRVWKPFWKSFDSFADLERWKSEQQDPELW
jgi:hypothetical protein